MKCNDARDLILSDHFDGELDKVRQNELERHLLSCAACGALETTVRKELSGRLANIKKEDAPAYLWQGVKDRITHESSSKGFFTDISIRLRDIISGIFRIPKPVTAFAATAIIIIALLAAIPVIQGWALDNYLNEQADFMVRLNVSEANGDGIFDTDIKTGVENIL